MSKEFEDMLLEFSFARVLSPAGLKNERINKAEKELVDYVTNLESENVQLLETLKLINKICDRKPPYHAYGDNEAGCYMANLIEEIQEVVNSIPLPKPPEVE